MSQFPYGGYDPETGEYMGDSAPNPLLARRDPNAPPQAGQIPPQAGPQAGPPQGTTSGPQPGTSFDPSRLYQPHYLEEKPNNFGMALQSATRSGSLLNIVGALTGGGKYAANHAYNEAEHRKFEDSLQTEQLRQQQERWDAYTMGMKAREDSAQKLTGKAALAQMLDDSSLSDEVRQAITLALTGQPKNPPKPPEGEAAGYEEAVAAAKAAGNPVPSRLQFHNSWTTEGRPEPKEPQNNFTPIFKDGQLVGGYNTKTGAALGLDGKPLGGIGPGMNKTGSVPGSKGGKTSDATKLKLADLDNAIGIAQQVSDLANQIHAQGGGLMSKGKGVLNKEMYSLGLKPSNPLYAKAAPLFSALKAYATGPMLHGIRNQVFVKQIQQHMPDLSDESGLMSDKASTTLGLLQALRDAEGGAVGVPEGGQSGAPAPGNRPPLSSFQR